MPPSPQPCVCKGWIAPADSGRDAIASAVVTHNDTDRHLAWRYRQARVGRLIGPESPAEAVVRHLGVPVPRVSAIDTGHPQYKADHAAVVTESELRLMDGNR